MPELKNNLDRSKFDVTGADALNGRLEQGKKTVAGLDIDWSNTNAMLDKVSGAQAGADAQAQGQDQTAGRAAELAAPELGANGGDSASVGKAMMQLGSRLSAQSAAKASMAQEEQVAGANQEAQALRKQTTDMHMMMMSKELTMQNTKAQMSESVTQMQKGLALAQAQLRNMYNQAVSKAKNAQELGDLRIQHDQFNQIMAYVGMGLGAASAASAAAAGAMAPSAADRSIAATYDAESRATTATATQGVTDTFSAANSAASFWGAPQGNGQGGY